MSKSDIAVSKQLQAVCKRLDKDLKKIAGQRMGFSLIVFSDADNGQVNYASNCARNEAAVALREVLERWENKDVIDVPAHNKH